MAYQLKRMRERAGLSQKEAADRLGIKVRTYGSWERGEAQINLEQAFSCAVLFQCSLDELAGRPWPPAERASDVDDKARTHLLAAYDSLSDEGREVAANVVDGLRATYPQGPDTSDLGEETA